MTKYKPDFERVKQYFRAFWAKELIDRPLLSVTAPRNALGQPVPYLAGAADGDYQGALAAFRVYAENTYFAGESYPAFDCSFGPDQYAAFFGGTIRYDDRATSWVEAFLDDVEGGTLRLDKSPGGVFARLTDFVKQAAAYADGDFLVNMLDLHGNLDALSAARGPQNLLYDLYDSEDAVVARTREVLDAYDEIVETVAAAGSMYGRGFTGWSPTFCEQKFAVVQCDVSCMLSPEMVRKFCIPAIEYEVSRLAHCVYHYDGKEALGHLEDILAIEGIDVIQWVPGSGNPRSIEWMELLHKIQAAGKGLWIYDWTPEEIVARCRELKPEGLIFSVGVDTPQRADALIEQVARLY